MFEGCYVRGPHACRLISGKRNGIFSSAPHNAGSRNSMPTRRHKFRMAPGKSLLCTLCRPLEIRCVGSQPPGCGSMRTPYSGTPVGIPIPEHVKEETQNTQPPVDPGAGSCFVDNRPSDPMITYLAPSNRCFYSDANWNSLWPPHFDVRLMSYRPPDSLKF